MNNLIRTLTLFAVVCSLTTASAQAPSGSDGRAAIIWPPGYIEPNTPNMPYVTPDTPQGTGPYKAIMATDPGAPEFVIYYPANLAALGAKKLPILVWGNGSCAYAGNHFRNFLTEIASHGYLAVAGGAMGPASGETITMASNNPIRKPGDPPTPPRPVDPSRPRVTVELLTKGIDWAVAENHRTGSKFNNRLDTAGVAVMGQSCGAGLAASFGPDKRIKTIGVWSGGNKTLRDKITVPVLYITGDVKYDVAYPAGLDDFENLTKPPIFYAWRENMTHLGTYRQFNGGELAPVATAWLDWQLKNDETAAKMFKGKDCGLCRNPNWHVQKKNID